MKTRGDSVARVCKWLAGPLPREVARVIDRLARTEDVVHVAVLPDVHLAEGVSIGTVVATRRSLLPQAVGGDPGCGMAALRLDCDPTTLGDPGVASRVLSGLRDAVPPLRHRGASSGLDLPSPLDRTELSHPALNRLKEREGRPELGTLGRGNHFLELEVDESGFLWLMVHTGSRALGQAIRDAHLRNAERSATGLGRLDADSEAGGQYLSDLAWAAEYARWNRRAILDAAGGVVCNVLHGVPLPATLLECDHNHVRRELHFGEALWVHRKGAVSAGGGEPGIIPGSMGSPSFHTEGRGCVESRCSSSHGAGRACSRGDAFRSISKGDLLRQMRGVWFDLDLADRLRDEAPSAYKDIGRVMRAQRDLTRIVRKLRPILSYKGV